jgi:uncharacterized integral membrane protein
MSMSSKFSLVWVYFKLILGLVLVGLALIFVTQNADVVTVKFLSWRTQISQSLVVFFSLIFGVLAGSSLTGWVHWRRGRSRRRK